jgi:hypothetical protein
MASTPDTSKPTEFDIAAKAPPTPLALSTKARTNFDLQGSLPRDKEMAAFATPSEAIDFMKSILLLAGVSIILWKDSAKTSSYCDITCATERHTSALSASLAKTANSLLVVTQELHLCCARNKAWTGATFLKKCIIDKEDPTNIEVTTINLLKTFHEVSVDTMIGLARTFWSEPDVQSKVDDGVSQHYI